ncbi:hypothetical protein [Dyella telluris]|uniref:Peptidase A2 domain-containing protein n=1 Tax=Dyella telluris TaxID=2763498 RepID=A0A7G8Q4Z3_9GAMM|nr:hypothetical protein [Dyella telluris]QNK01851.1 hypothetical protein H8F01_01335 [Dyella telluris]
MILAWSLIAAAATTSAASHAQVVPTVFEAGHFFATPETVTGERLKLLVDTGGGGADGLYVLGTPTAQRLKLPASPCKLGNPKLTTAALPAYQPGRGIPAHDGACDAVLTMDDPHPISAADGILGAPYLDGRVWTFDYPARKLVLQGTAWTPAKDDHAEALGFQNNDQGKRVQAFPRVQIRVDGEPIDMLLDTGATAFPSDTGRQVTGTPTVNGFGVTSYITHSQLESWHARHPEWRVLENGDVLFAKYSPRMIEVPSLEIAGWSLGPVWFTERPDSAFHGMMAELMDKTPEGAIGGNVLGHFVLTIDYPKGMAYVACPQGCQASAASSTR